MVACLHAFLAAITCQTLCTLTLRRVNILHDASISYIIYTPVSIILYCVNSCLYDYMYVLYIHSQGSMSKPVD